MLILAEDILLIALDDDSGKPAPLPPRALSFTLAAGLLMDLVLQGTVEIKSKKVHPTGGSAPKHTLLQGAFDQLKALGAGDLPVQTFLVELAGSGLPIRERVAHALVEQSILAEEEERIFKIIKRPTYPMIDGTEEAATRARLRMILLQDKKADERDKVLISLLDVCGLIPYVLEESEVGRAQALIQKIREKDSIGDLLADLMADIQEALSEVLAY